MAAPAIRPLPVVDFLKIPEGGEPYLEGHRCAACGETFLTRRVACPKCCSREPMQPVRLATRGHLYAYCIVHRSFPGIDVPYVSAIVDLEGGGTVKGNLVDVAPDPAKIQFGMPVEVVFRDALGRKDKDGNSYLSYFFRPAG
jgi:uncharacterized OB-fold protein